VDADPDQGGGADGPLDLLQSLRRVCSSVNAATGQAQILQALVDAIAEQTPWRICWVSAIDVARNALVTMARTDRVEYSTRGRMSIWPLQHTPALATLHRDAPVIIQDAQDQTEFPDYGEDARMRNYRSGVVLALGAATEIDGRPLVLHVQARERVVPDAARLVFLRQIADAAGAALRAAEALTREREIVAQARRAVEVDAAVIDAMLRDAADRDIYDSLQEAAQRSLIVLDATRTVLYCGRSPHPELVTDSEWHDIVTKCVPEIVGESEEALAAAVPGAVRLSVPIAADLVLEAEATRVGVPERVLGCYLTVGPAGTAPAIDDGVGVPTLRSAVAAVMVRGYLEYRASNELRSDLLGRLFAGELSHREEVLSRAGHLGLILDAETALVALQERRGSAGLTSDQSVRLIATEISSWPGAVVVRAGAGLALLVPMTGQKRERLQAWLGRLKALAESRTGGPVAVSLGGVCRRLEDYPAVWRRCQLGVQVAQKLRRSEVMTEHDFGVHRLLLAATDSAHLDDFVDGALGRVLAYDKAHGTDLFLTLEEFSVTGGRFQETARNLQVHVSTLRYRLQRIEELYGHPLDTEARFEAALAAKLYRLIEGLT